MRKAEVKRLTAPKGVSQFRAFALAFAAVVAVGAMVAGQAVAAYGDRTRVFGWTAVRSGSGFVARVAPDGPAAGSLRNRDRIVAVNGDRRQRPVQTQLLGTPRANRAVSPGPADRALGVRRRHGPRQHRDDRCLERRIRPVVHRPAEDLARIVLLARGGV